MTLLLLGATGLLGHSIANELKKRKIDFLAPHSLLTEVPQGISAVINAVAYTAVDKAKEDIKEVKKLNVDYPLFLAQQTKKRGIPFFTFSSDYVFSGYSHLPYKESDETCALNYYGTTKALCEKALLNLDAPGIIFRTSTLYDIDYIFHSPKNQFLKSIWIASLKGQALKVVDDQVSNPTSTTFVASVVADFLNINNAPALINTTTRGQASRFEFAKLFLSLVNPEATIIPIKTNELNNPNLVVRPKYSVLDTSILESRMIVPTWDRQLQDEYLKYKIP